MKCWLVPFLLFLSSLYGMEKYERWFVGPMLSPCPITLPVGDILLASAFCETTTYGAYAPEGDLEGIPHIHTLAYLYDFEFGLSERIGADFIGSFTESETHGGKSVNYEDTILRLGYQLFVEEKHGYMPTLRLIFEETFPTGKYDQLDPEKEGADLAGEGAFTTGIYLVAQKSFTLPNKHPIRFRGAFAYFLYSNVFVRGLNYYAGAIDEVLGGPGLIGIGGSLANVGTVHPGNSFSLFLMGEYALSHCWGLIMEGCYIQGARGDYTRRAGNEVTLPSYNQLTLCPALEWTLSHNVGMLFGTWFSVSGKNTAAFRTFFLGLVIEF